MFKKTLSAALIFSLLVLPVSSVTPAGAPEASAMAQSYLPGDVPAETDAAESMSPALHALVLAMLNHDVGRFDSADASLTWEGLYNMLSLYGQMDSRAQPEEGTLTLPGETVADYSAALGLSLEALGERPASLADRLRFDRRAGSYTLACGSDDLAQLQLFEVRPDGAGFQLTGALVYLVDGSELVRFQAGLQPQDTMFGCAVTSLHLS